MTFYITAVTNHGETTRTAKEKADQVDELVNHLKQRPTVVYIQVTIDHGKREPEEPGLAVVDTRGYNWMVAARFMRQHTGMPFSAFGGMLEVLT